MKTFENGILDYIHIKYILCLLIKESLGTFINHKDYFSLCYSVFILESFNVHNLYLASAVQCVFIHK